MAITDTITIRVIGDNTSSKAAFNQINKDLERTRQSASALSLGMQKLGRAVAVLAAADTVRRLAVMANEFGVLAGRVDAMGQSFRRALGESGRDNPIQFLEAIQKAARGTLSDIQALTIANQALATGTDALIDNLPKVVEQVRFLSVALGRNASEDIERVIKGINKLEQELLDELGIVARAETAFRAYAAQLGKSSNELSAQERQTAFALQVIEELDKRIGRLGPTINEQADAVARVSASWQNFSASIGRATGSLTTFLNERIVTFLDHFAERLDRVGGRAEALARQLENAGASAETVAKARELEKSERNRALAIKLSVQATERLAALQDRLLKSGGPTGRAATESRPLFGLGDPARITGRFRSPREEVAAAELKSLQEAIRISTFLDSDIALLENRVKKLQRSIGDALFENRGELTKTIEFEQERLRVAKELLEVLLLQREAAELSLRAQLGGGKLQFELGQPDIQITGEPPPPTLSQVDATIPQTNVPRVDIFEADFDAMALAKEMEDFAIALDEMGSEAMKSRQATGALSKIFKDLSIVSLQTAGHTRQAALQQLEYDQAQRRVNVAFEVGGNFTKELLEALDELEDGEKKLLKQRLDAADRVDRINASLQFATGLLAEFDSELGNLASSILALGSGDRFTQVAGALGLLSTVLSSLKDDTIDYIDALERNRRSLTDIITEFSDLGVGQERITTDFLRQAIDDLLAFQQLADEAGRVGGRGGERLREKLDELGFQDLDEALQELQFQLRTFGQIDTRSIEGKFQRLDQLTKLEGLLPGDQQRSVVELFNAIFDGILRIERLDPSGAITRAFQGFGDLTTNEIIRIEDFITELRVDALRQQQEDISNAIQEGLSDQDKRAIRLLFDSEEIRLLSNAQREFAGAGAAGQLDVLRRTQQAIADLQRAEESTLRAREQQARSGTSPGGEFVTDIAKEALQGAANSFQTVIEDFRNRAAAGEFTIAPSGASSNIFVPGFGHPFSAEDLRAQAEQAISDLAGSVQLDPSSIIQILPGVKLRIEDLFDLDDLPEVIANAMLEAQTTAKPSAQISNRRGR